MSDSTELKSAQNTGLAHLGVDLHRHVAEVLVEATVAFELGRLQALSDERLGETFCSECLDGSVDDSVLALNGQPDVVPAYSREG